MTLRDRVGRLFTLALALLASAGALGCGGTTSDYQLKRATREALTTGDLRFLLVSDTQYSVPFTDYDVEYQLTKQVLSLPPAVTSTWVGSFYRHAGANFALPYAFEHVLEREAKERASFGLFGGDLLEFSCQAEADRMFATLTSHQELPMIVTIGNHDSAFHGAYDTDAVARSGQGDWDMYSFGLWGSVCSKLGGRSTKSTFIARLLEYYEKVWALPLHDAVGLPKDSKYPLGIDLSGTARKGDWELTFAFKLGGEDAQSHRQSYLYQRFVHRDPGSGKRNVTVTVLDTMDYGSRRVLCDLKAMAVQVGLAGAISAAQVEWLESLPKAEGYHLVLSHYLPFQSVERPNLHAAEKMEKMSACDTTFGTKCLGARLVGVLPGATFVYGHVHKPFEEESIASTRGASRCTQEERTDKERSGNACECIDQDALPLVRLPSLMDNKQYVVFEQGDFRAEQVAESTLPSLEPFATSCNTCVERFAELVEIEHNVRCLKQREAEPGATCAGLEPAVDARKAEATELCNGMSAAWKVSHDAVWQKLRPVCDGWPASEQWRCILREQANDLAAGIPATKRSSYGAALLASVHTTNRGNKKRCDAKR